jgi:ribosomal protein S18 acetylase RimI-like enzyme
MAPAIRPARATDVDALSAIENAVFSTDRISERSFRRLIRSASASVLVAADGGQIAGYLVLLFRSGSERARLYSIAAAPGRAGAGLGSALLEAAEGHARGRQTSALRLEVRAGNSRAIGLYERNGYRRFGRLDGYYADGEAALRFEKKLMPRASSAASAAPRNRAAGQGIGGFGTGAGDRGRPAEPAAAAGSRDPSAAATTGRLRHR